MDNCEDASWEMYADAVRLGSATKKGRHRRTGGLSDRVGAKKIKTNAVALEGATRPSTRSRVQWCDT
jgi:hypothetical protein